MSDKVIEVQVRPGYSYMVNSQDFRTEEHGAFEISEEDYDLQAWKLDVVADLKAAKEEELEAEAGKQDEDLSKEDEKEVAEQEEKAVKEPVETRDMGDKKKVARVKKKKK